MVMYLYQKAHDFGLGVISSLERDFWSMLKFTLETSNGQDTYFHKYCK